MSTESRSLRASLRALPRPVWVVFFGTFLNKFGTFVVPFLVIYMTRLGYSPGEASLAISVYGAGYLAAAGMGGHLADKIGRRRTIILSMATAAVSMMCLCFAQGLLWIVIFAGLAGLTGELYRPASSAMLTDLVPEGQRITAFAAYRLAFNAGWAFGPAVAGFLAEKSFVWLFIGDAATSLLYGVVAWIALPPTKPTVRPDDSFGDFVRTVRADRRFLRVLCAFLGIGFIYMQICSTLSLDIARNGIPPAVYGRLLSLNGTLVVLFELPITLITRRFPARWTMAVGYALIGAGFAMNALARTPFGFACNIAVLTIGEMISMPVASAYVADLAPVHLRGRYMGLYGLTWALALFIGPSVGMWLFSYSSALLWSFCGGLGILAAAITLQPAGTPRLGTGASGSLAMPGR